MFTAEQIRAATIAENVKSAIGKIEAAQRSIDTAIALCKGDGSTAAFLRADRDMLNTPLNDLKTEVQWQMNRAKV